MVDSVRSTSAVPGNPICLHVNRWLRVMQDGHYHYVEFNKTTYGVVVVPQFPNGDYLLVRLPRLAVFGESLEFPRGGIDTGESTQQTAIREMREETGYAIEAIDAHYLGRIGADTGLINGYLSAYKIAIPENAVQGAFDTNEINAVVRVTPAQLRDFVRQGQLVDGMSLAAYALLRLQDKGA
jgi:ADP-ribose pyrophosphatase